jgi:FAD:protein FMN transferase
VTGAAAPADLPSLIATTAADMPRRAFVQHVMGLPVSIHVRGPRAREPEVGGVVEEAFAALRVDDAMFSTWKADSIVSQVRRGELSLADAGPRFGEVVVLCEEAARRTGSAFSAWLPTPGGGTGFDPTGLVKGWAVEQAFDALVDRLTRIGPGHERHDALISGGGDVAVACARTDTADWVVGIEDPRDRSRVLARVPLRTGAVATSGTAARGAHILDPATGAPASGLLSASVIGPSLTWADVYATAAFVRGRDAVAWLGQLSDHAAVLVDTDGVVRTVTPSSRRSPPPPPPSGNRCQ